MQADALNQAAHHASNAANKAGQAAEPGTTSTVASELDSFSHQLQDLIADPSWSGAVDTFLPILLGLGRAILVTVLLLIVVSFVARWARRAVERALQHTKLDATLKVFLTRLTKYAVWVLAVPVALGVLGIEATSLAAVIGAAGLAIGLGLQGALSNISAGILLLVLRPVRIGDLVNIQGVGGEVTELGLFYTVLNSFDNEPVYIPNQQILSDKVRNLTGNSDRRIEFAVGVAYGTDLHEAESILIDAAKNVEGLSDKEKTAVYLSGFGDSSINFLIHVYCPNRSYLATRHTAIHAVNDALKKANIEIPFPQRTLSGTVRLQRDTEDESTPS